MKQANHTSNTRKTVVETLYALYPMTKEEKERLDLSKEESLSDATEALEKRLQSFPDPVQQCEVILNRLVLALKMDPIQAEQLMNGIKQDYNPLFESMKEMFLITNELGKFLRATKRTTQGQRKFFDISPNATFEEAIKILESWTQSNLAPEERESKLGQIIEGFKRMYGYEELAKQKEAQYAQSLQADIDQREELQNDFLQLVIQGLQNSGRFSEEDAKAIAYGKEFPQAANKSIDELGEQKDSSSLKQQAKTAASNSQFFPEPPKSSVTVIRESEKKPLTSSAVLSTQRYATFGKPKETLSLEEPQNEGTLCSSCVLL